MKKIKIAWLLFFLFASGVVFSQGKSKPIVIVKKEFCPPEEILDESTEKPIISKNGINELMLKKCLATLSYSAVVSKLNNKYTITKWKYVNHHNGKQIDTIIIITDKELNDRFVYYKQNKSAGKTELLLITASIGSKLFIAGSLRVGMAQLMVDRTLGGKFHMEKDIIIEEVKQSVYYIKDEQQNNYFNFSFENGYLKYIGFAGLWD